MGLQRGGGGGHCRGRLPEGGPGAQVQKLPGGNKLGLRSRGLRTKNGSKICFLLQNLIFL